jgi:hypothetical protein
MQLAKIRSLPFQSRLSAWLRYWRANDTQTKHWESTIEQIIAELDALNHSTEQDFLRIGGKLVEFIESVNLMSSELTALVNVISGEEVLRASEALAAALDLSIEMRAHYAKRGLELGSIGRDAGRLKQTLSGFEGTVSTFHTLGVLTRVETARLGTEGSDFRSLADDLRMLTEDIGFRVEGAREAAAQLSPLIESAKQEISSLEEKQANDLPPVVSKLRAGLVSFGDIQSRVQDSSGRLAVQYGVISEAFKKLIVSLQFHDITRQQVEHVIEALRQLCPEHPGEKGSTPHDRATIDAVLALQSLQLTHAQEKFASSVGTVTRSLNEVAVFVGEMGHESQTLTGLSEDEKSSFFLQMEKGCAAILAGLEHCTGAETATSCTTGVLGETIGRMRESIEEIRAIEIHIHRMALNGGIRAIHVGASGESLSVLAGSMQVLSVESRQLCDSLVAALSSLSAAADRLSGIGGPVANEQPGIQDPRLEAMRVAVTELHSLGECCFAQIAQIISRGDRLCADLSATRDEFSAGSLFEETVCRVQSMLNEIGGQNQSSTFLNASEDVKTGLAAFAMHYTMQAERDVFDGVGLSTVPETFAGSKDADLLKAPPEEAGNDIEFF